MAARSTAPVARGICGASAGQRWAGTAGQCRAAGGAARAAQGSAGQLRDSAGQLRDSAGQTEKGTLKESGNPPVLFRLSQFQLQLQSSRFPGLH